MLRDFADRSLKPHEDCEMVVKYQDSSGKKRVKGGSDLKASQAYPVKFPSFGKQGFTKAFVFALSAKEKGPQRPPQVQLITQVLEG